MIKNLEYYFQSIPIKNRFHLVIIFIGLLLITLLEMFSLAAIPGFVAVIIDADNLAKFIPIEIILNLLNEYDKNSLIIFFSISILSFFILKNIFIFVFIYFENYVYFTLGVFFSKSIFLKYQHDDYEKYLDINSPVIIRNCIDIVNNHVAFLKSVVDLFKDIFLLIVIFSLVIFFSSKETFYILLILIIFTGFYYYFVKKKQNKYATQIENNRLEQIKLIESFFGAFKDIKLFNLDRVINSNFTETTLLKLKFNMKSLVINATPRLFIEVIGIIFIFLLIFIISQNNTDIKMVFPTLALYVASIIRLIPIFSSLTKNISTFSYFKVSSNILLNELNESLYPKVIEQNKIGKNIFLKKKSEDKVLDIKNISFKYPKNKKFTLSNVNFEVNRGDFIGIFGKSGSGKTTLIDLLTGFLKPSDGTIFAFSEDTQKNVQEWQNCLSYVGQTSYLLDASIEENIAFNFSKDKINYTKISKALELSELTDFINTLPKGIKTQIGNKGFKISGGQRQRILIARALFKDSKVIILDEGTNAIDLKTELKILENLSNDKNSIKIIVSHRKESISKCNRLFKLDEKGFNEIKRDNL